MFEKLNEIVKENNQTFLASELNETNVDAAINEATGVIVDVLKSELDNGKAKDLMSFFSEKDNVFNSLTRVMVNKYANRLNRYFNLNIKDAKHLSEQIIPTVMRKFVKQTVGTKKEENGVIALLNWLSGYTVNFENFFLKLNVATLA